MTHLHSNHLRVLIIGFGSIGRRHYQLIAERVGEDRVHLVTRQQGAPGICYRSIDETFQTGNDYSHYLIASETALHLEQLHRIDAAVEGKRILVEKPLGMKSLGSWKPRNKIFVAYNLRFHPLLTSLRDWVADDEIRYVHIQSGQHLSQWRPGRDYRTIYSCFPDRGGGVLRDLSHELDYLQWIFGEVSDVQSFRGKVSELEIISEDLVQAIGTTTKGVRFGMSVDYISRRPLRRVEAHGTRFSYYLDFGESLLEKALDDGSVVKSITCSQDRNLSYRAMLEEWLSGKAGSLCQLAEGDSVMRLIERIEQGDSVGIS